MRTLEGMYKSSENEFEVRKFALNWYVKSVLKDEDLETIEKWYSENEVEQTENETEVTEEGE